jgi:starch phosphorylase
MASLPDLETVPLDMNDDWIAYFSMEIGIDNGIPTYSGGLGVLAGDTILSASDLGIPLVAFTLLYRKGYFTQRLDPSGAQREEPVEWKVSDYLEPMEPTVSVRLNGRSVQVRTWKYAAKGLSGHTVPVFFLDTDLPENSEWDRTLTNHLYGGDPHYRLCQEAVLGIGGLKMARALGYGHIRRFHMNEGHAALLTIELLQEAARSGGRALIQSPDVDAVRRACVFTTHTPVSAGHDRFPVQLVQNILGPLESRFDMHDPGVVTLLGKLLGKPEATRAEELLDGNSSFNMTYLALNLSRYVNGVAKRHGEVSRNMFPGFAIEAITNGVHAGRWTAPAFQRIYDRYIGGWRKDNFALRHAAGIPKLELWNAHIECKTRLIDYVNTKTGSGMDVGPLTIGFARRAAAYKRPQLLFSDLERLRHISNRVGRLQIIYAGKAHPDNHPGKETIRRIFEAMEALKPDVAVAYLADYDMEIGALMTAGSDVWLNTPEPPMEASGTSGMKAALNGVPSFSIVDGWWVEGHVEGVTGWSIGTGDDRNQDAASLYQKLEETIAPLFYREPDRFLDIVQRVIAFNGSFFTTHRMLHEYVVNAYL